MDRKPEPPSAPQWNPPALFPAWNEDNVDDHLERVGEYETALEHQLDAVDRYIESVFQYRRQLTIWNARNRIRAQGQAVAPQPFIFRGAGSAGQGQGVPPFQFGQAVSNPSQPFIFRGAGTAAGSGASASGGQGQGQGQGVASSSPFASAPALTALPRMPPLRPIIVPGRNGSQGQRQAQASRGPVTLEDVREFFSKFVKRPASSQASNPSATKRLRMDPTAQGADNARPDPALFTQIARVAFTLSQSNTEASLRVEVEGEELEEFLSQLDVEGARMEIDQTRNLVRITAETETLPHPVPLEIPIPPGTQIPAFFPQNGRLLELTREGRSTLILTWSKEDDLPGGSGQVCSIQ